MRPTKCLLMAVVFGAAALLAANVFAQEGEPGAFVYAQKKSSSLSDDEQGALGGTRTLNTAEITYRMTYKKGYSVNLAVLGEGTTGASPSETQAGLVASDLAKGRGHNYIYTYKPGAKDSNGYITAYTIVVRPTKWRNGLVNFFTDQTGVIRWTRDNCAPTAKDEPIDSLVRN